MPVFPPGRHERVEAQKGYFTVHGNMKTPINDIPEMKSHIIQKIELDHKEALSAVFYLENIVRIDEYDVFKDLDALGRHLSKKFRTMQGWRR
jgi:hypothetical protein